MAGALLEGWRVAVFPEGKPGHDAQLMPFYSAVAQAAVDAFAMVQPVTIVISTRSARNTDISFTDERTFATSLGKIIGQSEIIADLTF